MIIAVAGGKGGTGKTLVSTSLALAAAPIQFLDCDVEEPNAQLFLSPRMKKFQGVTVKVPRFQGWKGEACWKGVEFCRWRALAEVRGGMLIFPELCTSCGGCFLLCPDGVLKPVDHQVGTIKTGVGNRGIDFTGGELRVGQQRTVPIIRAVKEKINSDSDVVIDCPPGSGRTVLEAVRGSGFCLLVTEPTPFGLHDLRENKKLLDLIGLPGGVVINRTGGAYQEVNRWCEAEGLKVLLEIPFDFKIAQGAARGLTLQTIDPVWEERLRNLWETIRKLA